MNLFSTLLSGGVMLGRICQSLAGTQANKFYHEETGTTYYGKVASGSIIFTRKNGQAVAFNSDIDNDATISTRNGSAGEGTITWIPGGGSVPLLAADDPDTTPYTVLLTGVSGPAKSSKQVDLVPEKNLFRLTLGGFNSAVYGAVTGFKVRCTTTQLVIVTGQLTGLALTYMYLNSDKGASVTSQARVEAKPSPSTTGELSNTYTFDIGSFDAFGVNVDNDTLSGDIYLECDSLVNIQEILGPQPKFTPFDSADIAFLEYDWPKK